MPDIASRMARSISVQSHVAQRVHGAGASAEADMTCYFAAETMVMLAWVPTTAGVGMK